jgi:hypothetical protein
MRLGLALLLTVASSITLGAERDFAFTWSAATLREGRNDVSAWLTPRLGRTLDDDLRSDLRFVWSRGWSDALETQVSSDFFLESTAANPRGLEPRVSGLVHWAPTKATQTVGFGAVIRASVGLDIFDAEARLLVDKRFGNVQIATNVAVSRALFWKGRTGLDIRLQESLSVGYHLSSVALTGVELVVNSAFTKDQYEGTAFYLGPTLSLSSEGFWMSVAVTSQVASDRAPADWGNGDPAELRDNERFRARLVLGVHTL